MLEYSFKGLKVQGRIVILQWQSCGLELWSSSLTRFQYISSVVLVFALLVNALYRLVS